MVKNKRKYFACPYCSVETKTSVGYTRKNKKFSGIKRTRKCLNCRKNFHTIEMKTSTLNFLMDRVDVATRIFGALIEHPKILELLDYAKKEVFDRKSNKQKKNKKT